MDGRKTILLTSVGGRVGESVLSVLEPLRDRLRVVGVNSIAQASQNFRCDRAYLVPPAAQREEWLAAMRAVLRAERPDLVLPLRDGDLMPLAVLKTEPEFAATLLYCGDAAAIEVILDKARTAAFARAHGLAFAETATTGEELEALVERQGFPLIAKPRRGSGAQGVRLLRSRDEARAALGLAGYIVQEFIAPPPSAAAARLDLSAGLPFYFALPDRSHISALAGIAPDGTITYAGTLSVFFTGVEIGGCALETSTAIDDLFSGWARALASLGARGIVNLQCRKAGDRYVPFEINGRIPGGADFRRLYGQDAFAGALVALFGTDPIHYPGQRADGAISEHVLGAAVIVPENCRTLESEHVWAHA